MQLTANHLAERRLSDLARTGAQGGPDVYLVDAPAVAAAVADGHDPRLYYAVRDVFPRRVTAPGSARLLGHGADGASWSADLVVYDDGTLPGGEPFRSTGHWNPADQLEIFEVFSGRVLLLSGIIDGSADRPRIYFQECRAGDLAVVPFGAWHLTYVLDGPAMVFNVYTGPSGTGGNGAGPGSGHDGSRKYRSRRGPAEVAVTRSGEGYAFAFSPSWRQAVGDPVEVSCPAWLRAHMSRRRSLTDLHVSGSEGDLERLLSDAEAALDPKRTEAVELWR